MDIVEVLKIAEADLRRRLKEMSPKVDAQIEETLKICEQRLKEAGEPAQPIPPKRDDPYWDAEFNFWYKIITGEVERTRFNEGYEPIQVDLYQSKQRPAPDFQGKTQVGHVRFNVTADWAHDSNGVKILRIRILKA